jgi:hypothetical protein
MEFQILYQQNSSLLHYGYKDLLKPLDSFVRPMLFLKIQGGFDSKQTAKRKMACYNHPHSFHDLSGYHSSRPTLSTGCVVPVVSGRRLQAHKSK